MYEKLCQSYLEFLLLEFGEPWHLKFYKVARHIYTLETLRKGHVFLQRVLHPCVLRPAVVSLYL